MWSLFGDNAVGKCEVRRVKIYVVGVNFATMIMFVTGHLDLPKVRFFALIGSFEVFLNTIFIISFFVTSVRYSLFLVHYIE